MIGVGAFSGHPLVGFDFDIIVFVGVTLRVGIIMEKCDQMIDVVPPWSEISISPSKEAIFQVYIQRFLPISDKRRGRHRRTARCP